MAFNACLRVKSLIRALCVQVLVWTTDLVRTGNITQLEMDPHQRTTQDYDEHHKQRQAQSALNMAMDPDEESDSDGYRR